MHHPSSSYPCYGYFGIASYGSIWVPERWIHLGHEETLVGTWKQVPLGTIYCSRSKKIENTFQHVQRTMRFPSWATTQQEAGIPRLSNVQTVQTVQTSQGISTACRSCSEGAILQFPLQLFQGGLPQSTRHLGPAKRHAFQLIMHWETSTLVQWKAPTVPQDPTFEVQKCPEFLWKVTTWILELNDLTGIWQDRIRTTNGDALHFSAWTQRMTMHTIPLHPLPFGDSWGPRSISIPAIASFRCPIKASSCPSGYSNGIVDVIQGQTTWFPFREHPVSHGVQLANTNYPAADIILKEKHDFWEFFRQSTSYIYNWNQLQTSHALPGYECKRGRCCGCTRQWFCLGKSMKIIPSELSTRKKLKRQTASNQPP